MKRKPEAQSPWWHGGCSCPLSISGHVHPNMPITMQQEMRFICGVMRISIHDRHKVYEHLKQFSTHLSTQHV